jgi:hypothetical protein
MRRVGSSLSRAARTAPADPPPTMRTSAMFMISDKSASFCGDETQTTGASGDGRRRGSREMVSAIHQRD